MQQQEQQQTPVVAEQKPLESEQEVPLQDAGVAGSTVVEDGAQVTTDNNNQEESNNVEVPDAEQEPLVNEDEHNNQE